jgi:hypothetical protein
VIFSALPAAKREQAGFARRQAAISSLTY